MGVFEKKNIRKNLLTFISSSISNNFYQNKKRNLIANDSVKGLINKGDC